jgi:hypothetical protein
MPKPRTDLADDINRLVKPQGLKQKGELAARDPRTPIPERKGAGRSVQATSGGGAGDAIGVTGSLESADGLFAIVYDYHYHNNA